MEGVLSEGVLSAHPNIIPSKLTLLACEIKLGYNRGSIQLKHKETRIS